MAKELNEETSFNVSIKTLAGIAVFIFTVVGLWFTLQADIEEAKELPLPQAPESPWGLKKVFAFRKNQDPDVETLPVTRPLLSRSTIWSNKRGLSCSDAYMLR